MFQFADAVNLSNVDPKEFPNIAAYATGKYVASTSQLERFKRHKLIGVLPNDPDQAAIARTLDVERYDATVDDAPEFIVARYDYRHNDPEIYNEISSVPSLLAATAHVTEDWYLWVAWWWLRSFPPLASDVINELRIVYGVTLPDNVHLSSCQWENLPTYDRSVGYLRNTFTKEQ